MRNDQKSLPSLVLRQWSQAPNTTSLVPAKSAPCTMFIAAGVNFPASQTLPEPDRNLHHGSSGHDLRNIGQLTAPAELAATPDDAMTLHQKVVAFWPSRQARVFEGSSVRRAGK